MALNSVVRRTLRQYPGLPVALLGVLLLVYDAVFVFDDAYLEAIDGVIAAAIATLAGVILFGSYEVGNRGRTPIESIQIFAFTLLAGLTGFLTASMLIAYQLLSGVPIVNVVLLIVAASATTASLGVWLALYYFEIQEKTDELFDQRNRVTNLNKRLTILQRVLSHNLRNEIAIIQGHAETLLEHVDEDGSRQSLEVILKHTNNLESLSADAHQLRQIWERDETVSMDVVEIVRDAVAAVEDAEPAVEIETDLPESMTLRVHPQFRLAVEEALSNAIIHNDPSEIRIAVALERVAGEDPGAEILVSDTGTGTPQFEWETLQQTEELPLKHGTGLGLWLIYWLVEKSDGQLSYESNDPRGTVVKMQLPDGTTA